MTMHMNKIDRNFNDDLNTSIKENSNKKESISSFLISRARFRFLKTSRQTRASGNHNET